MSVSREALERWATELGFTSVGVIAPEHALPLPIRPDKKPSFEPKSVIVMSAPGFRWSENDGTAAKDEDESSISGEIAAWYFASNEIHARAGEWVERAREAGLQAEPMVTRTKTAALYAGLGVYRMNTLLYTPKHGSHHGLQVLAVDEAYEPDAPTPCGNPEKADVDAYCLDCRRCVQACPTGALDGKGWFDINKCLRFHMNGRVVPVEYRRLMGRRLVGCEVCQAVCPKQPEVIPTRKREDWPWLKVSALLEASRETLDALGAAIGANYARQNLVQSMAALMAGNVCLPGFKPALEKLIDSEGEAVREHALWALNRIRYGCPDD
ncbi:hypothetical protein AGMMS49992_08180 [Clostridia bacterium]|nr:hypothetical protein AGMMS49992_08180 [Clostridia bacterium]